MYTGKRAAMTLLLGLATMTACGEDEKPDTGEPSAEPASEPAIEPSGEPEYGVADTSTPEPDSQADYGVPDIDEDGDGYSSYEDCNDNDPNTYPGAAARDSETECMTDKDGDMYGDFNAQAPAVAGTDCDDSNADISPVATEVADDGIDSNCNGNDND
jgi:hypothetical protein